MFVYRDDNTYGGEAAFPSSFNATSINSCFVLDYDNRDFPNNIYIIFLLAS